MSRSRRLLLSHYSGVSEVVHIDAEHPDHLIMETIQDCEPIIERAKLLSEMSPQKGEVFRHVGTMPQIEVERAMREGWWNDGDALKRWLNDPDHRAFRSWHGVV